MTARTARLPFDHLIAEIAAFPLCSEAALANPVTHLAPGDSQTESLWREAERVLIPAAPGISLDELTALRDKIWFGQELNRPHSLQHHLRRTTEEYLESLGASLGPKIPDPHSGPPTKMPCAAEARQGWMWLTFALPADLLLAAITQERSAPDLISPPVQNLLRRGFAESHLHYQASLDFSDVWALIVDRIADATERLPDLDARGSCLADGKNLLDWLVRVAAARFLLAQFLVARRTETFTEFLHGRMRVVADARIGPADYSLLLRAVDDLHRGTLSAADRNQIRMAYGHLITRSVTPATDLDDLPRLDPLHTLLNVSGARNADQQYVHAMCAFLNAPGDEFAGRIFWQTVRVRAVLYRYITQRPLTPGLAWFIRFFGRMSKVRGKVADPIMIQAAQRRSGIDDGLVSLEIRTGPPHKREKVLGLIQAVDQARRHTEIEHALVLHFSKSRPRRNTRPYHTHADPHPDVNPTGYRFAGYFGQEMKKAASLADTLYQFPRAQFVLRGLDICSDELAVPTWVMKPLVKLVRKAARNGARYLYSRCEEKAPMLRTTVHSGEDFAHLLTGLRNIHEAVELLDLREGDRIGHGLALGVDARAWAERVGRVAMSLEDRVFDLTWEWAWWSRRGAGSDGARLAYLSRELCRLGLEWFGIEMNETRLERLREDLADPVRLKAAGFPEGKDVEDTGSDLRNYLTRQDIFERGRKTHWIETAGEAEAVERISLALRSEVSRRGLAIEVNPTSNLLIADLRDLSTHPLWRLAPPRPRPDLPPLAVTIGSDDPLVFNCRLPGEYQLLFDSLVLAGLTDTEALDWLERSRQQGLERRFSTRLPREDCELLGVDNVDESSRPIA